MPDRQPNTQEATTMQLASRKLSLWAPFRMKMIGKKPTMPVAKAEKSNGVRLASPGV